MTLLRPFYATCYLNGHCQSLFLCSLIFSLHSYFIPYCCLLSWLGFLSCPSFSLFSIALSLILCLSTFILHFLSWSLYLLLFQLRISHRFDLLKKRVKKDKSDDKDKPLVWLWNSLTWSGSSNICSISIGENQILKKDWNCISTDNPCFVWSWGVRKTSKSFAVGKPKILSNQKVKWHSNFKVM